MSKEIVWVHGAMLRFESETEFANFLEQEKARIEEKLNEIKPKPTQLEGSWDNIYSDGSKIGVKVFAEIQANCNYDFHMVVVFQNEQGQLAWAEDSGCSCPAPFEDYKSWDQLEKLPETYASLESAVKGLGDRTIVEKLDFLSKVAKAAS